MNIEQFNDAIREMNRTSYSFGNDVLYSMASDPGDLCKEERLDGAMWLIGRAYAASPQRRFYKDGKKVETSNDGRELFFKKIAQNFNKDFLKNCQEALKAEYKFDKTENDIHLLADATSTVLQFNIELSKAIEIFDKVDKPGVYCINHISFSSKFLHFYFPQSIFIIDNYAFAGARALFNGNEGSAKRWFDIQEATPFGDDVYKMFSKGEVKDIFKDLNSRLGEVRSLYEKRRRTSAGGDNTKVDDYIKHCARSYLLGKYINNKMQLVPSNQVKTASEITIAPMSRLTDAVFLNIKTKEPTREDE